MDNVELRKEVRASVKRIAPYLNLEKMIPEEFIEGIIDDVMGAFNREFIGTYTEEAVTTMMGQKDTQCEKIISNWKTSNERLGAENTILEEKITKLKKEVASDAVKKELERKIAVLQDKNRILKKVVRASLEDL